MVLQFFKLNARSNVGMFYKAQFAIRGNKFHPMGRRIVGYLSHLRLDSKFQNFFFQLGAAITVARYLSQVQPDCMRYPADILDPV